MALVFVLAGCSTSQEATVLPSVDGEPAFDAVLIEMLGTDDIDRYLAQQERRAADLMISCMAERGYEFSLPASALVPPQQDDVTTLDFAQDQGFDIVAAFERLVAFDGGAALINADPNENYMRGLTPAERASFITALDGSPATEAGQLPTETGCRGESGDIAFANWRLLNDKLPQWTGLAEARDTHPDMLDARATWRACMTDQGLDYAEPDSVVADVRTRMRVLVTERYADGGLPLVESEDGLVLAPEAQLLVDEVKGFEVEVAVANWRCRDAERLVFDQVDAEVQQDFVDRNRDLILAMVAERE